VLTQTVNASDFALSSTPTTAAVAAGKSASFTLTVTPQGPFSNPIGFSCSGLPAGAGCTFSPATVTPNANTATSDLTISTTAPTASLVFPASGHGSKPLYAIWLILPAMLFCTVGWAKPRRRKLLSFVFVCLLAGSCLFQAACGGASSVGKGGNGGGTGGTPTGTYSIAITGTAGSTQHSTTISLTIQ
jgi:hypothetical protein